MPRTAEPERDHDHDHDEQTPRDEDAKGGTTATQAPPRKKPAPAKPDRKELPPWKVLLHNDEVNGMDDVVRTIRMLTPLSTTAAVQRMLEAHRKGVTLLLTTHKERAELYQQQFASRKLTVTLEPA